MIAAVIALTTLLLAVFVVARYGSPAFRARMELPKYRFQASLQNKENTNVESESTAMDGRRGRGVRRDGR